MKSYLSCDTVCKATTLNAETAILYPTEFLNSLPFPIIPNHKLKLKADLSVMLQCNIYRDDDYSTWKKNHRSTDNNKNTDVGQKVYIPRITMLPNE